MKYLKDFKNIFEENNGKAYMVKGVGVAPISMVGHIGYIYPNHLTMRKKMLEKKIKIAPSHVKGNNHSIII